MAHVRITHSKRVPSKLYREAVVQSEPWKTLFKGKKIKATYHLKPGEKLLIARINETVAGLLIWKSDFLKGGYLKLLSVHPQWRRHRVGQKLLRRFEKEVFRNQPNAYLCVSDFNTQARKFYRKQGYKEVGVLKKLIHPRYDEILMRRMR